MQLQINTLKAQCVTFWSILLTTSLLIHVSEVPLHLSYISYDVRGKSQNPEQTHVLDYYRNVVAQYGHLLTSGAALFVNIDAYYCQKILNLKHII